MTNARMIPTLGDMTQDIKTPDFEIPAPVQPDTIVPEPTIADTNPASAYASAPPRYETFEVFYPYYLSEKSQANTRRLNVFGTGLAIVCLTQVVMWGIVGGFWALVWAVIFSFGTSWAAHYFIEKNKPTTFTYPAFTLMGDLKMFWEIVTRKRAW